MNVIETVAELMVVSAVTAPKSKGQSFIQTKVIKGDQLKEIAEEMVAFGIKTGKKDFDRDGKGIAAADALVLIGIKNAEALGLNCQACGFTSCAELNKQKKTDGEFKGPYCSFRMLDMGIALGSAAKTAGMLNVDNRIMYRVGAVARDMGIVDWDFIMGIPLSVTGKSIYFDR
jgi:uncharacterized ferredoxin-like protein